MAEYIERKVALAAIRERCAPCGEGIEALKSVPAADVAPVRYGEWIEDDYAYNRCSACGWEWDDREYVTPYCPNCGARMDGADNE